MPSGHVPEWRRMFPQRRELGMANAVVAPGRLPLLGHTLQLLGRRTDFTGALRQHGDLVRIHLGPMPCYVATDKDLVQQILVAGADKYERGMLFEKLRPLMGSGLATADGQQHRRQRRLMQPAFHRRQIAGYVAGMVRLAAGLVDSWREGESRAIDEDMQLIASTVVADALFSTSLDTTARDEAIRNVTLVVDQVTARALSPAVLGRLPLPVNRRYDQAVEQLRLVVSQVVAARRADPDNHDDLLSMLLAARDAESGEGLTDQEIHDQVMTLFAAGVETTARMLAWFFHEVGRRPDIEERLRAEITGVLAGAQITVEHVPQLTYTRQVIDEVLRHYAVWLLMRRSTMEVELAGTRLPAGTEFIVSPYGLHHDPRYFPDPERFDPDRWSPERVGSVPRGAYLPFAAGVHNCIGNMFAVTEITVVAATVLSRVRLVPVPGKPVRTKTTNLPIPSQLPMTVERATA